MSQDHLPSPTPDCQPGQEYLDMVPVHIAGGVTKEPVRDEAVRVHAVNEGERSLGRRKEGRKDRVTAGLESLLKTLL